MEFLRYPLDDSFALLGRRWAGPVLMELLNGRDRFNSLLASVPGLNPRTLSSRLDDFEKCGIVTREAERNGPGMATTRVYYRLTKKGEDLRSLMRNMASFSLKWYATPQTDPSGAIVMSSPAATKSS